MLQIGSKLWLYAWSLGKKSYKIRLMALSIKYDDKIKLFLKIEKSVYFKLYHQLKISIVMFLIQYA